MSSGQLFVDMDSAMLAPSAAAPVEAAAEPLSSLSDVQKVFGVLPEAMSATPSSSCSAA